MWAGVRLRLGVLLVAWSILGTGGVQAQSPPPSLDEAQARAKELTAEGRYGDAIPHAEHALKLGRKAFGPGDVRTAALMSALGKLYERQGRYKDAEPLYKRALALATRALGAEHAEVANGFASLANLYRLQGRYRDAEPLFKRALQAAIKALGAEHLTVARLANNAALNYLAQGSYRIAEQLYLRALSIVVRRLGSEHLDVAAAMNNVGNFYYRLGRFDEAERLHKQALTIKEKALGADHPDVAVNLNNLAEIYRAQGAKVESERIFFRALAIREARLGPDHPAVADTLSNLGVLYYEMERFEEAEPLLERALSIHEAALGRDHVGAAQILNNLASIYYELDRPEESESTQMRALVLNRKAYGREHVSVATNLHNLGVLKREAGAYDEAEALHGQALDIMQRTFGDEHPDVAHSQHKLTQVLVASGDFERAIDRARLATKVYRNRALGNQEGRSNRSLDEQARTRPVFVRHVEAIARHVAGKEWQSDAAARALRSEAFEIVQLAKTTSTSRTIAQMAARFAAGDDDLARAVRARQDALQRREDLDADLLEALANPPDERDLDVEARLRREIGTVSTRIQALDEQILIAFPDYAELVSLKPMKADELRGLLAPDEALLVYLVDEEATYLWVGRHDRDGLFVLDIGAEDLEDEIAELRSALDPTGIERVEDIPPFDVIAASFLYEKMVAPAEVLFEGAKHLMVVPDEALQSLPFGVLVTDKRLTLEKFGVIGQSEQAIEFHDFFAYREVPWLSQRYAITVLPSAGSLQALRKLARPTAAARPLLAFGDPMLEGPTGGTRGLGSGAFIRRGATTDVAALRQLPRLPDTAVEVRALALTLGATQDSLYLQDAATESRLRAIDLSDYRILAFATHGLLAGEFGRIAEPALVLTPPEKPSESDDGLLTASEIARLHLDADWVLLSACNTAAADGTPGAEGLSGLAKAFFFAGSRALLVSHWSVVSDAAMKLTTGMFRAAAGDESIGRAEALRRSMAAVMADDATPHYAHPMFWAPFIVVGEGGAVGASPMAPAASK
jgi:CHAT domain-containing protein/tetratricopeptide (TPR) repeat protein